MNKRAGTILILAVCLVLPMFLGAQERIERAQPVMSDEFWGSFTVQGRAPKFLNDVIGKDVRKRFRLKGEMGYRSADTFFAGRQVYFDGSIRYTFSDLLKVGVEQRYAMRPGRDNRTRTALKIYLGQSFGRLDLGYRFVYQHNYREMGRVRELFRNRFSAEYNIRKWKLDPVIQTEFFTWANPYGLTYIGTRYKLGTSWSPWKGHSITFFFVHDRERDVAWPDHRVIYSLDYAINLRRL